MFFVDRRKTTGNKSAPNREALLRRIKMAIKGANPSKLGQSVTDDAADAVNPVRVASDTLHEPRFMYESGTGDNEFVLVGNEEFERGDRIPLNGGGSGNGSGKGAGDSGSGEDDFVVNITSEEFMNIFFEDCELPNLEETNERVLPETEPKHAGFSRDGTPASLRVVRSFKQAMPRRKIMSKGHNQRLLSLMEELDAILQEEDSDEKTAKVAELKAQIEEVSRVISAIPFFEKMDLRYAKTEQQLVRSVDAVLIIIMDISGSMSQYEKTIARKFFALQYAFIRRKYPSIDVIFIAHTETAMEMDEDEFFSTRIMGGTVVSSSYDLALEIINKRYDPSLTNIYISQASDGDNYDSDNAYAKETLFKKLIPKVRHMSYANVGRPITYSVRTFLDVAKEVAKDTKKLSVVEIKTEAEVFPKFRSIYSTVKNKT